MDESFKESSNHRSNGNGVLKHSHDNGVSKIHHDHQPHKTKTVLTRIVTSPWNLFRFSKPTDVLYILFGLTMATIAGSSLPLMFLILGFAISEFNAYNIITSDSASYFCNITSQYTNYTEYVISTDPVNLLRERVSTLSYYLIGLATSLFFSSFASNITWTYTSLCQTNRMRLAFLDAVLKQDIGHYDLNSPTELPTRLADDIQKIEEGIGYNFANFVQECIGLLVGLIIAISLNWKLALVTSSLLPLLLGIMLIVGKVSAAVTFKEQSTLAQAGSIAEEVLSAIKTVVAFGGERKEIERYTNLLKKAKTESYKKQLTVALIYGFYTAIFFGFYSLGIWYGGTLLLGCEADPGVILTVVVEIAAISFNLGNALPLFLSIIAAVGAAAGVYPIIDHIPSINNEDPNAVTIDEIQGDIEFSDVVFSYPSRPEVLILRGLDLHIKAGRTVAIVGPSGSGKSTVLQLIQRLYTHNGGLIKIDGIDIRDLNVTHLRSQIGVVSQEPDLFNVSISENISYGKIDCTGPEIVRAAKKANALNFINMLPRKFDTIVGDGGTQLSGGQKQCIAIARALIRDPKVLLLDEATSALDTDSEKLVQEALDKAREGRTTIVIAHRLSTIQSADLIMSIDNGLIVECGTHNELMSNRGLYYELVQNQTISDANLNATPSRNVVTKDFANAYRQSIRHHRQSVNHRRLSSSSGGGTLRQAHPSVTQAASITTSTLRRAQRPSARQLVREGSAIGSLGRRVVDGMSPLSDFSVPPTPRTPKFSPHNIFLDDVFELPEDGIGSTAQLNTMEQPRASWKKMLELNKHDWWLLAIGISGFVFVGVLLSTIYVLFSEIINVYSSSSKEDIMRQTAEYSTIYAVIGIIGFIVHFVATFSLSIAADRLTTRLRQTSFENIMTQDISFFDKPQNSVSMLTARLAEDASEVNKATGMSLGLTVRAVCNILASYIIIFEASWVLGFLSLVTLFVFIVEGFLQLKLTNLFVLKSYECQSMAIKTAIEAIDSVYTVVTQGIERTLVEKYKQLLKKPFKYDIQGSLIQSLLYAIAQSSSVFILACAMNVGAYIYTSDEGAPYYASFEEVFRAIGAMFYTGWLFKELFRSLPDTQSAQIAASNMLELFDEAPKINRLTGYGLEPQEDDQTAKLKLSSVHFTYPSRPGISILPGINLNVKHGKSLAIVGPSGCGKSTVISLIERFYDPISGSVLFNGINATIFNVSWLRRQMSLVSQEPVLFDMSIADNIRYGALFREISDNEVMEAAKTANIHNFIMSLPKGYETNVGSKGTRLSGGQKQCIAIARALIRDPKVLLLDEATSALDTDSEKLVQEALDKAREGRTTIVIAHRLSTIQSADNIVVLHKGLVVEQGTHSELMGKKGTYYFMHNITKREED